MRGGRALSIIPLGQVFIVDLLGRVISRLFGFVLGHLALDVTGLIVQIIQRFLLGSVGLGTFFFGNGQSILLRLVDKTRQVPFLTIQIIRRLLLGSVIAFFPGSLPICLFWWESILLTSSSRFSLYCISMRYRAISTHPQRG